MSFLPSNYQAPKTSRYMKLKNGENKCRILSKPILGWEDWTADKKPIRYRYTQKAPRAITEARPPRHFWAFIVWNYEESEIQILQITQATVRDALENLSLDKDWGEPFFYDIKINKTGEETKTKYTVSPLPHKTLAPNIKDAFHDNPCCLEALFDNANPFEANSDRTPTPGVFSKEDLKDNSVFEDKMSPFEELKELLSIDFVATEHLGEYLETLAKERDKSVEQIISSAMLKDFFPKFKALYVKWLSLYKNMDEAVPF